MARLNRTQVTTSKFTIHEDDIAEDSDIPVTKPRSRLRRGRKFPPGGSGSDCDDSASRHEEPEEHRDEAEKELGLASRFSSMELNGCANAEKTLDQKESVEDTSDLSLGPLTKTKKTRRALGAGTTRANPLLHPLPSTSAKKGRYSLENVENFRPKNESWGDEGDPTSSKSKRLREKPARTLSKTAPKTESVEREYTAKSQSRDDEEEKGEISGSEFDSLDDFIVDDDEDISYLQDSDDEIDEDDDDEGEEKATIRPKTPRKLFRGAAPASVRSNRGEGTYNTTDPKSVITVNELGSFNGHGKPSNLFNLKPTIDGKGRSNTPVKKPRANLMDPIGGSRQSQPENHSSSSSQTTGFITPPTSPSKPRLQSPSKTKNRIPASPHRPSIDAFWNPEVINEWNESHSPRKTPGQRRGLSKFEINLDQDDDESVSPGSPTASPIKDTTQSPSKGSPTKKSHAAAKRAALLAKKQFNEKKVSLAENFFKELDDVVTGSEIQRLAAPTGGVRIIWSKTLNTTAGRANWKRVTHKNKQQVSASCTSANNGDPSPSPSSSSTGINTGGAQTAATGRTVSHHASIELAEKVIDSEHRLLTTLAHEYCHLANFMISNVRDKPHGTSFKRWAEKCRVALSSHHEYASYGIKITTKHSYDIHYKYLWCCKECGCEYGRHSKSIDPKKSRCGKCTSGVLVQVRPKPRKQKSPVVENKENQDPLLLSSKRNGQGDTVDLTKSLELGMQ